MDESEPAEGREEQAEQEEDAVPLANQAVVLHAIEDEAKPATRRSLRVKGGKADLATVSTVLPMRATGTSARLEKFHILTVIGFSSFFNGFLF